MIYNCINYNSDFKQVFDSYHLCDRFKDVKNRQVTCQNLTYKAISAKSYM